MSPFGTFETCPSILRCPFTGVDRKSPWSGRTDANDPKLTYEACGRPLDKLLAHSGFKFIDLTMGHHFSISEA
jgi:hypothetical protein